MLKNNIKRLIISLIAILLVVSMGSVVFATESDSDMDALLNEILKDENGEQVGEDEELENIPEGEVEQEDEEVDEGLQDEDTDKEEDDDKIEERPETTPHAGLEDYTGLIFVAIFAVSAIFAYKKVKEYNI